MGLYLGVAYGHIGKSTWQTGMYFRNDTLAFPFVLNAWSAACTELFDRDQFGGRTFLSLMSTSDGVDNLWIYEIDETTDRKVAIMRTEQGFGAGIDASAPLPSHDAVMVLWYPQIRTRSIARMYLPRVVASETTNGFLSPGAAAATNGWSDNFISSLVGDLCFPVVRNRREHTDEQVVTHHTAKALAVIPSRADTVFPAYV